MATNKKELMQQEGSEKSEQQNVCVWQAWQTYYYFSACCNLDSVSLCSVLLQKHLFKGRWNLAELFFQTYLFSLDLQGVVVFFP